MSFKWLLLKNNAVSCLIFIWQFRTLGISNWIGNLKSDSLAMKRAFAIFLCLYLISVSLTGQILIKSFEEDTIILTLKNRIETDSKWEESKSIKDNYHNNKIFPGPYASILKSQHEAKQQLDSVIGEYPNQDSSQWIYVHKEIFAYDAFGNMTTDIQYSVDTTGKMILFVKDEYAYDAKGRDTLYINFGWDSITSQWIVYQKFKHAYDVNGDETVNIRYFWNTYTKVWSIDKQEFFYDSDRNLTQRNAYTWDSDKNQWFYNIKDEYRYDAIGHRTLETEYYWNVGSNSWINGPKSEYIYNPNGNLITSNYYQWNSNSKQWETCGIDEYEYDSNGNQVQMIYRIWNNDSSRWINNSKVERTYNATGDLILSVNYGWNSFFNRWSNYRKYEITYDDYRNFTQSISYNWKYGNNWYAEEKYVFNYNNLYSYENLVIPLMLRGYSRDWIFLCETDFNHMITSSYSCWTIGQNKFGRPSRETYFYSEKAISGVPENHDSPIKIYPNPANDYITVETDIFGTSKLELFDIQGSKVFSLDISGNKQISVSQLKTGLYFYRVTSNNKFYNGKLIIH